MWDATMVARHCPSCLRTVGKQIPPTPPLRLAKPWALRTLAATGGAHQVSVPCPYPTRGWHPLTRDSDGPSPRPPPQEPGPKVQSQDLLCEGASSPGPRLRVWFLDLYLGVGTSGVIPGEGTREEISGFIPGETPVSGVKDNIGGEGGEPPRRRTRRGPFQSTDCWQRLDRSGP